MNYAVGVLVGGRSRERERSLATGRAVADALAAGGHRVQVLDTAAPEFINRVRDVQVAFLAVAGRYGEDGRLQGFLETCGIPYTGSGVLASAVAMHKPTAKAVVKSAGVPVLPQLRIGREESSTDMAVKAMAVLGNAVMVKPESEGSSIGMAVARSAAQLSEIIGQLRTDGHRLFLESFVQGRAVTVGVIEMDGEAVALPAVEIRAADDFYNHRSKLDPSLHTFRCPAAIDPVAADAVARHAVQAHQAIGCSGYSRSDFIVAPDGSPAWLELNTLPGLRPESTFALMAAAIGMSFEGLVGHVLASAHQHLDD